MQILLSYVEDLNGIQGTIDYIHRTSGAILIVQQSRVPDEIVVEKEPHPRFKQHNNWYR